MKENTVDNLSSMITDRSRNELRLHYPKLKRTTSLVSRRNSAGVSSSRVERCDFDSGFCFRRAFLQNYLNFKRSGAPSRFMFFKDDSWMDYSEEVFGFLKSGFVAGMPAVEVSVEGSPYLFDFFRMLQIDFQTGSPRSIAWIDVNGQCFFPESVVGGRVETSFETIPCPKLEIEVRIGSGNSESSNNSLRWKLDQSHLAEEFTDENIPKDHHLPEKTEPKIPIVDLERPKWPCVEILKDGDRGYGVVKHLFLDGIRRFMPEITVTSISRCLHTSPLRNARLKAFHSQMAMTKAARGDANVRFSWHGTSAEGVASILTYGFGQLNRYPTSEAYGVGVYLSTQNSSHSSALLSEADENGEKHVILCRVIVGNAEKVEAGSLLCHPSSEEFDVGVDDSINPRWYIVWSTHMNRNILPEYVVSYKSSDHLQGLQCASPLRKGPSVPTMSFLKLFSEMRNSLPSSSLQALNYEYTQYKAGKISKDVLIRQVRLIAGDKLLVSTIQRIRGH